MLLLDLTLEDPVQDLALDEALLLAAEAGDFDGVLRLWEPLQAVVVVGRGSRVEEEVRLTHCQQMGIPVLRRCSGGAAIVAGPGCLMYSLVFRRAHEQDLCDVDTIHHFVLQRIADALSHDRGHVTRAGTSDLVIQTPGDLAPRKISGNSMRLRRNVVLYHGTVLYDFPLHLVGATLGTPPRVPDYRGNRTHTAFVTNLNLDRTEVRRRMIQGWQATTPLKSWPREQTAILADEKYSRASWNLRH